MSTNIQGTAIGFVSDSGSSQFTFVSGIWIVFGSTMNIWARIRSCHEVLGCSSGTVETTEEKMGLIWGSFFGVGWKW